jgi:hypothetical protein
MAGNVAGIVTGRKGPCLYHSLRDGRTCSIFLVPVEGYMTLATGIRTGSATGSATACSWGHRIILVLQSSVALSVETVALPVEILIFIFTAF